MGENPCSPLFPAKDQAIVLSAIKDVKLTEYVVAVGNVYSYTKKCDFRAANVKRSHMHLSEP